MFTRIEGTHIYVWTLSPSRFLCDVSNPFLSKVYRSVVHDTCLPYPIIKPIFIDLTGS